MFVDIGPKLQYNLLCDGLPEDKQLREQLQMSKLVGTSEKIKKSCLHRFILFRKLRT
jgi:hypothetical protein